jgi:phasin family protein
MSSKTKTPVETMEQAFTVGKDRMEQAFKTGSESATKNFEKAVDFSRKQMDEMNKAAEEMNSFAKGNLEAVIASSQAAAKGFETLTKAATDYSKKSMEGMGESWKTLTSAKTPKDFFEVQTATAKSQYDAMITEASKMSELTLKVMADVFEPLSSRMSLAAEKFAKPLSK